MVSFLDCLKDIFAHVTLAYTIRTYRWYVPTFALAGGLVPTTWLWYITTQAMPCGHSLLCVAMMLRG